MYSLDLESLYQQLGFERSPFSITPDTSIFFPGSRHLTALRYLKYGLTSGGFTLLTGEVGLGKTLLCRHLLKETPQDVVTAYIINPPKNLSELIYSIYYDITGKEIFCPSLGEWFKKINNLCLGIAASNKRVAVILDEAHLYDQEMLEGLRLLSNLETEREKLIYLILVGQPELEKIIAKKVLRPLAQRIGIRYKLKPFTLLETMKYIEYRMKVRRLYGSISFSRSALALVHYISGGSPRLINHICDRALLSGYADDLTSIKMRSIFSAVAEIRGK